MTGNLSLYDSYLSELLETEYSVIFLCLFYIIYNKHIFKTFKKCCLSDCFFLTPRIEISRDFTRAGYAYPTH